jgi:hypothetical protein
MEAAKVSVIRGHGFAARATDSGISLYCKS